MERSTKKRFAIFFVVLILLVVAGRFILSGGITTIICKNHAKEKIINICSEYGLEDVKVDIDKNENEDYVATVYADSKDIDTDPKYFEMFNKIENIGVDFSLEMNEKIYSPESFEAEYVINGEEYKEEGGQLFCGDKVVQYETVECMLRITHRNKVPYIGMPETAAEYTAYGWVYTEETGERYWKRVDYKYYFTVSEDEKQFDGFTDKYIDEIDAKYDPPTTTTESTTKKYHYKPTPTKPAQDDDPYNAKDYYHAEDFYYDHYDDFFDYYDAEDYFNEHSD